VFFQGNLVHRNRSSMGQRIGRQLQCLQLPPMRIITWFLTT